jgi:FMN phosphatase YigB (HAD superfamily)
MQHIAFDIGNVIFDIDFKDFINEFSKLGAQYLAKEFIRDFANAQHIGVFDFQTSLELSLSRHREFKHELDYSYPTFTTELVDKVLKPAWNKAVIPNNTMLNFIMNLKNEGVKIAFLSNIGFEHARYLRENYSDIFNGSVQHFSYEVGAIKPQTLFYQSFLLNHEDFSGCVYLDDMKENVVSAAKHKFDAMHFDLDDYKSQFELKKKLHKVHERVQKGW